MIGHEIEDGTRVWCDNTKSSGKKWALLTNFEVLGIVDFWQFWKNAQLQQCITSSILSFWRCSWTFLEILRCPIINPFGLISF